MKTIDETVKVATERYAKSQGGLASNYKNFRDQVQELLTTFSAEVQEEYRRKVRAELVAESSGNVQQTMMSVSRALNLPSLRDPEPEPSEAAMRVVRFFWPDCADYWAVQKARIVDQEFKKGCGKYNA